MTVTLFSRDSRDTPIGSFSLPVVFGRSADADVKLDDRWASRKHCVIDQIDGNLVLRDLNSTHGTFVNRELVLEAILSPDDEISVGLNVFVVHWDHELCDAFSADEAPSEVV